MGILDRLFRSRDKPSNSTAGSAYRFFFGGTPSGKSVNEKSAMQMTAVYACVRILAESIAGLPLHLFRYDGNGGKERAVEHPLYFLLHDEPNPEMTSFVFRETMMTHLLLWGNAFSQVIRNGKGEVVALYLWQTALTAGTPDTILNRPIYTSPYVPELAAGNKAVLFGDMSYYWVVDRQGRTFKRLNELFATTGQVGFMTTQRVDGKLTLAESIKVMQVKKGASGSSGS